MADHLQARCVLASATEDAPRTCGDPTKVRLTEAAPAGAIALRLDAGDAGAVQRAREALGVDLPLMPNTWKAHGDIAVLWQAYDEWLVLTSDGQQGVVAVRLAQALAGRHSAVTDVSDLRAAIDVSGPLSRDLLRKGCAVDLHARSFKTGNLALTALARVRVVLWQTSEVPAYQLLVERSYAHYLWDWLVDAAVEFDGPTIRQAALPRRR